MIEYGKYQGEIVAIKPCTRAKFDTLQLDARRIMGLAPALQRRSVNTTINFVNKYLIPPEPGSDTYNYAMRIINLKWPVVTIWRGKAGREIVEYSTLVLVDS